jgi:hypothetical protein
MSGYKMEEIVEILLRPKIFESSRVQQVLQHFLIFIFTSKQQRQQFIIFFNLLLVFFIIPLFEDGAFLEKCLGVVVIEGSRFDEVDDGVETQVF